MPQPESSVQPLLQSHLSVTVSTLLLLLQWCIIARGVVQQRYQVYQENTLVWRLLLREHALCCTQVCNRYLKLHL